MRAKDLIGKRIARVRQSWQETNAGRTYCLDQIDFTDGSYLRFNVAETDRGEYEIEGTFYSELAKRIVKP